MKKTSSPSLTIRILMLAAALSGLAGCSGEKVASQRDPSADLSQYHTFDWAPAQANAPGPTSLLDKQLQDAVQAQMAKIGLENVQPGTQPDLFIARSVNTQNVATSSGGVGMGFGVFPGVGVGVSAPVGAQTRISQQAAFTLSLIDSRRHSEVWRGTARGTLEGTDRDLNTIQSAVENLVGDFANARQSKG